ncbi:alpha/beta hydrolase [Nitrospirillum sp. BR 11163]|uniref:alpha/beta fold hydrolase n=1 Tax=Nitrospirillum sp. BR 11163 TaxID=3104323 RepID=UPI002AFF185B|nr:alpha/beta hydrolase [Nitrospirillum sp. BR 11163]MEA1675947.1 alpha/beta hydrolase [Nitrospirillum sp. BR 11163]
MKKVAAALAALALTAAPVSLKAAPSDTRPTIVLVHGAFVDGSGWAGVHRILTADGYKVVVVQNPTTSLADDVATTKRAVASANGQVVLVGHSYGGVVITEAGTDPKVAALVYVAAFAPDANESVAKLVPPPAPDAPPSPILAPVDGFLSIDTPAFPAAFAADVDPQVARFMADSQVPWGVQAFAGQVTLPAWKSRPSWYLIPRDDRIIPPAAQRAMAGRAHAKVEEAAGSHAIYVADPKATATVIEEAAAAIARH